MFFLLNLKSSYKFKDKSLQNICKNYIYEPNISYVKSKLTFIFMCLGNMATELYIMAYRFVSTRCQHFTQNIITVTIHAYLT